MHRTYRILGAGSAGTTLAISILGGLLAPKARDGGIVRLSDGKDRHSGQRAPNLSSLFVYINFDSNAALESSRTAIRKHSSL